jgi:hypothetical protein
LEIRRSRAHERYRQRPVVISAHDSARFITDDTDKWVRVVKASGLKME